MSRHRLSKNVFLFAALATVSCLAVGVDDAWRAALPRDADAATAAYLARLPHDALLRSNAYFEGGYWLQLWNFLLNLGICGFLLSGQRAARLRDRVQAMTRHRFLSDLMFGAAFAVISFVLSLPLTIYQGFTREHAYGMATQTFGPWLGEQLIGLAVSTVILGVAVAILYAAWRRAGQRWWIWGTGVAVVLMTFLLMIQPVFVDPLFNTYKPVSNVAVRDAVLTMAKANEVPATDVMQFDASRQTTRVSANVAGLFGSAAVRLNDNLLACSLPEIRAVMGHELGHYVMNHIYKMLVEFSVLLLLGFYFCHWAMQRLLASQGERWRVSGHADVAALPLLVAVFSVFFFLATPVTNTLIRVQEAEADAFGLNLSREPHGFAEAQLKLSDYRKPSPGALEEVVFYDHPSIQHRIHAAMQWREAMGTP
jgi:STE24 endopeptidase